MEKVILMIICAVLLTIVVIQYAVLAAKASYAKLYSDLLNFRYYVNHCNPTETSIATISERLKIERARPEMEDKEYSDLVYNITLDFNAIVSNYERRERANKINKLYENAKTNTKI